MHGQVSDILQVYAISVSYFFSIKLIKYCNCEYTDSNLFGHTNISL